MIANDYKNMRNSGKSPRFEEAFAFKVSVGSFPVDAGEDP